MRRRRPCAALSGVAAAAFALALAAGPGRPAGAEAGDLSALRSEMIDAAMGIMAEQEVLLDLQHELAALEAEAAGRRGALEAERSRLAQLLGGLQRLARVPPGALIVRPAAPLDAVRSAVLLRAAVPALEARAADLQRELAGLAALRRTLESRRVHADALRTRLDGNVAELAALAERRDRLRDGSPADPGRGAAEAQALAGGSRDLAELMDRAAAQTRTVTLPDDPARPGAGPDDAAEAVPPRFALALPPTAEHASRLQDGVLLPAGGTVILGYGEADLFGAASRGLVLEVLPGAPVIAPLDGRVRFAGTFRGYGDILILEHPGGYHTLIAGFGRIDVRVGQDVLAGEPVGVTPSPQTGDREVPTVYFEFRRNGQPIDPLPGLAAAQGRG